MFGVLVLEIVVVSVLLLPLPHVIRKKIVQTADFLYGQVQLRISLYVCTGLISMAFIDFAQKAFKKVDPVHRSANGGFIEGGYSEISGGEYLARKFYNQRNFYLTGIVLVLALAIIALILLMRKLVKWDDLLSKKGLQDELLAGQLKSKDLDISTLKKQIEGLQRSYNEKCDALKKASGSNDGENESKKSL